MSGQTGPHRTDRLENVLREALAARVGTVGAADLRPACPPSSSSVPRRQRIRPVVLAAIGLAAVVAVAVLVVRGVGGQSPDPVIPAGPSVSLDEDSGSVSPEAVPPGSELPASGGPAGDLAPGPTGAAPR